MGWLTVPTKRRSARQVAPGPRFSTLALLGCSIAVTAAAATTLFLEARPYFVSGIAIPVRLAAITSGALRPGPSFDSQKLVLDDCYVSMGSMLAKASPTSTRIRLFQQCGTLALRVTDASPTHAYAWLVGAMAAAGLGDAAGLSAGLARSQALAPHEAWLAVARVDLGETHLAQLDEPARRAHDSDIALLVSSSSHADGIVRRYLDDPEFRARLEAILSRLPAATQRRFVAAAQAALELRGS